MTAGAAGLASAEALTAVLATLPAARLADLLAGPPAQSAPWVAAAAHYGLPAAQLRLGRMLLQGEGFPRDAPVALGWFRRAAKGGEAEGANMVGRCLEHGWGAVRDTTAAARWYRRAARAGSAWADYNLGHLYLNGDGVRRNAAAAARCYTRAAEHGHARAMNLLGRCCEEGWGAARDAEAALAWYRRSAEAGYFRGQYNLASALAARGEVDAATVWFEAALAGAPPAARVAMAEGLRASDVIAHRALAEPPC